MIDSQSTTVDEDIQNALYTGLASLGLEGESSYTIDMYNKVDSTISDDFRDGLKNANLL